MFSLLLKFTGRLIVTSRWRQRI